MSYISDNEESKIPRTEKKGKDSESREGERSNSVFGE
jgi:hypothetical protein